jgi:hypothetical protein
VPSRQTAAGKGSLPQPSRWALLEWNDTTHLQAAGLQGGGAGFGGGARDG